MENSINEILTNALNAVGDIADVKTIIGEPIKTDNGTTIIPISKISFGVVSGGVDFLKGKMTGKNTAENTDKCEKDADKKSSKSFGGGGGTGISATPVGFLVIYPTGEVEMLNVGEAASGNIVDSITSLLQKSPDIVARFKDMFSKESEEDKLKKEADDVLGDNEKYGFKDADKETEKDKEKAK